MPDLSFGAQLIATVSMSRLLEVIVLIVGPSPGEHHLGRFTIWRILPLIQAHLHPPGEHHFVVMARAKHSEPSVHR